METCAGCGAQLDPAWKYCIHCGIAVDRQARPIVVPSAIRPDEPAASPAAADTERSNRNVNIALLVGGITAFVIAVAFIGLAIAYAVGALK